MALVSVHRSPSNSNSSSTISISDNDDEPDSDLKRVCECFFAIKGAALVLPHSTDPRPIKKHPVVGELQQHLQSIFFLLRSQDTITLAVRLESLYENHIRYMVLVSTMGVTDSEETIILGVDLQNSQCSVGLVLPIWRDVGITMDGDGGFGVHANARSYIFKPVSIQAMWSAIQCLYKSCQTARVKNYFPGGLNLTWSGYYSSLPVSSQKCCYEWNLLPDTLIHISEHMTYHQGFVDGGHYCPSERELTERYIWVKLKEIMMHVDLDNITCKTLRTRLEAEMGRDLTEYRSTIDEQALTILGQMDSASKIFDFLYLGSEWNASNYEELNKLGIRYVLNVTKEIDNFFPRDFTYYNVRVFDSDFEDLLKHWDETNRFIAKAKEIGSKVLVHCKMGVSRSASTVIAFVMKEKNWSLEQAYKYVKEQRKIINPIPGFMEQLEEYQGILDASKHRHNSLWRSKSESSLSTCESLENIPSHDVFSSSEDLPASLRRRSWSPDKETADALLGYPDPTSSCYAGETYLPNPSPSGRESGHFADEERESTSSGDDCSEIHIPVPTLSLGPGKGQGSKSLRSSVPDSPGLDRAEGGEELPKALESESSRKTRRKNRETGGKRSSVKDEDAQDEECLTPVKNREEEKDGVESEQLLNTNNNSASGLELARRTGEMLGANASSDEEAVPVDVRERISNIENQISRLDSTGSPEKGHLDSPLLEDLPLDTVKKRKEKLEQKLRDSLPGTPESGMDKTLNVLSQPDTEGEIGCDEGGQTLAPVTQGSESVSQGESGVSIVANENDSLVESVSGDTVSVDAVLGVKPRDISAIKGELFHKDKDSSSELPPSQYSSPSLSKLEPGSVQRNKEKFQSWQTKGWKSPALEEDPLSKLEHLKEVRGHEETVKQEGAPDGTAVGDSIPKSPGSQRDTISCRDGALCQSGVNEGIKETSGGEVQVTPSSVVVGSGPSEESQVSSVIELGVSHTASSQEELEASEEKKKEEISEPLPTSMEGTEQVSHDTDANVVVFTATGEEIPLQPGIVKRQTQDFEQRHLESSEKPKQAGNPMDVPGVSDDGAIKVCISGSESVEHGKDVVTSTYSKEDVSSGFLDRVDPSSSSVDTGVIDTSPKVMTDVGEGGSEENVVLPTAAVAMETPQVETSSAVIKESNAFAEEDADIHDETGEKVPREVKESSSPREQTGWKAGDVKKHTKELEKLSAAVSTGGTSGQTKVAALSRSTEEQEVSLTSDQLQEIRDLGKIILCKENSQEAEDISADVDETSKENNSSSADNKEAADSQKEEKVAEGDFVNVLERVRTIELKRCSSIASMSSEKVALKYRKRTSPDRDSTSSVQKKEEAAVVVEGDGLVPVLHDKLHVSVLKKEGSTSLNTEAKVETEYDQTRSETVTKYTHEAHSASKADTGQKREDEEETTSQSNTLNPSILRQLGPRGRRPHGPSHPLTRLRQSSGKHPFYSTM